jgi:hypothetical protein
MAFHAWYWQGATDISICGDTAFVHNNTSLLNHICQIGVGAFINPCPLRISLLLHCSNSYCINDFHEKKGTKAIVVLGYIRAIVQ